ncbi:MAG: ATP-dependent Clp protease ATP-binding subunit ClpX [Blastocatellia bacterium]|jgi:hypothetical protein|nr:ATP-dependent Clp protease ATP-binding subunit ClpX [Blastocatellia bacterium]
MDNQSLDTNREFDFIFRCLDALRERRYRDAVVVLEKGLSSQLNSPVEMESSALFKHLHALISYLEFRLEEDFGIQWNQEDQPVKENAERRCSFCGKNQSDAKKIIAGPGVFICDVCVNTCANILATS